MVRVYWDVYTNMLCANHNGRRYQWVQGFLPIHKHEGFPAVKVTDLMKL